MCTCTVNMGYATLDSFDIVFKGFKCVKGALL